MKYIQRQLLASYCFIHTVCMQKTSWWERMKKKIEHFEEQRFGMNGHFEKI